MLASIYELPPGAAKSVKVKLAADYQVLLIRDLAALATAASRCMMDLAMNEPRKT